MSTHTDTSEPVAPPGPKRIKPHQLAIGLGVGVGAFTLVSGVLPLWTKWHDESPVSRPVFGGIPGPVQLAFYTLIPMLVIWGEIGRASCRERGCVPV